MEDIKAKFEDVIRNDTPLQALLGGTPGDPRTYPYYSGEAKITPQVPGYMTYSYNEPTATMAVVMPFFTVAIWTREWYRAERIAKRMRELFDKKILLTTAPDNRRLYTRVLHVNDAYQQEPRYAGKNMQIMTSWSTV